MVTCPRRAASSFPAFLPAAARRAALSPAYQGEGRDQGISGA